MRQKYVIFRDGRQKYLNIKEYAVIETKVKKHAAPMDTHNKFTFYCEETYENKIILQSISNGPKALVGTIRTHNFYPPEAHATKIAETVIKLYRSTDNGPVELIIDDLDPAPLELETA